MSDPNRLPGAPQGGKMGKLAGAWVGGQTAERPGEGSDGGNKEGEVAGRRTGAESPLPRTRCQTRALSDHHPTDPHIHRLRQVL